MRTLFVRRAAVVAAAAAGLAAAGTQARAVATHTTLHEFSAAYSSGSNPYGRPVLGPDGNLYGTTYYLDGGGGSLYRVTPTGVHTTLHAFVYDSGTASYYDGLYPYGTLLVKGTKLYGTCSAYGDSGHYGTVWSYDYSTDTFTRLHSFAGGAADGATVYHGVAESAGTLYGVTYQGGDSNQGTIWRIDTDGSNYQVLHEFSSASGGLANPYSRPVIAGGKLWGAARYGGSGGAGGLWRINLDGSGYTKVADFDGYGAGTEGAQPAGDLAVDSAGNILGTASEGGPTGWGTIWKYTAPAGTPALTVLHAFNGFTGQYSQSGVAIDSSNRLYVTTTRAGQYGYGTLVRCTNPASGPGAASVLMNFDGVSVYAPYTGVVQGASSGTTLNFFGVSWYGGITNPYQGSSGAGALYKVAVPASGSATQTLLHSFHVLDTHQPYGDLVLNPKDGYYYGTTYYGGAFNNGSIFKVAPNGSYTTIHHFNNYLLEGANPRSGLCLARDGSLYGLTWYGGSWSSGTFFKVTTAGVLTVLRHLRYGTAYGPYAGLIQGAGTDTSFYAAFVDGGPSSWGTLVRLTPTGAMTVLRYFNYYDGLGYDPTGRLYQDPATKRLWGTCVSGGTSNQGVIFSIMPDGTGYKVHHHFSSSDAGTKWMYSPYGGLVRGPGSLVIGHCYFGGDYSRGALFTYDMTKSDSTGVAVLHSFGAGGASTAGGHPYLHEVTYVAPQNLIFGTTRYYGASGYGMAFSFDLDTSTFTHEYSYTGSGAGGTGYYPEEGLTLGPDCRLYSCMYSGGAANQGLVYSLDTGLEHGVPIPGTDVTVSSTKTSTGGGAYDWKVTVKPKSGKKVLFPITVVLHTLSAGTITNADGDVPAGYGVPAGSKARNIYAGASGPWVLPTAGASTTFKITGAGGTAPTGTVKVFVGRFLP